MKYVNLKTKRINFKCEMCGIQGIGPKHVYEWIPRLRYLINIPNMEICGKCAKREVGTKNIKEWRRIHGEDN